MTATKLNSAPAHKGRHLHASAKYPGVVERKRFSEKDAANAVYQAQLDTTWYHNCHSFILSDTRVTRSCRDRNVLKHSRCEMLLAVNYIHSHDIAARQQRNHNVCVKLPPVFRKLCLSPLLGSALRRDSEVHRDIKLENFLYEAKVLRQAFQRERRCCTGGLSRTISISYQLQIRTRIT